MINEFYDLSNDAEYLEHELINNPTKNITKEVLRTIVWPHADWERTPTEKHQSYPHQLTTEANVWLFFIKKKILPTQHDNTESFNYVMLLYCILTKKAFDLNDMIQGAILTWMNISKGVKLFSSTIDKLCLKYILSFACSYRWKFQVGYVTKQRSIGL